MATAFAYGFLLVKPKKKGGGFMSGRMKALLVALGALGFAAMNGSLPWGP